MIRPSVGVPFDAINDAFHDAYDRAVGTSAETTPLLVVLGDVIVVRRAGGRSEEHITPPVVHVIKSIAHLPVALFTIGSALDKNAMRERVDACESAIARATNDAEVAEVAKAIVGACRALLSRDALDDAALGAFAREVGPWLLSATDAATRIELGTLDEAMANVLDAMTPEERRTFEVIVAGEHQARARNLPMQYFAKLLGEQPGQDERLAYAEGARDEAEAVLLAGKRRVDRRLAVAFFGDAKHLQRDVLGDAAKKRLEHFTPRARI